jgi:hypothetical protein
VAAATQSLALIQQSARDHTRIARAIAARKAERVPVHLDHIEEMTGRAMKAEITALARLTRP